MIALLLAFADPQLVETGVGRFAVYADVASIERHGDLARMRELQVTEAGFKQLQQAFPKCRIYSNYNPGLIR